MTPNNIPHTFEFAKVTKVKHVEGVFAIEVVDATYRKAKFSGVIELANGTASLRKYKGKFRANTDLDWFGQKLKKHLPFVNLDSGVFSLIPQYSGPVVAGLGL
jgi:hypothetical protein